MKLVYGVFATAVLAACVIATQRGIEIGSSRGVIPQSARSAAGGYRSFTYWGGGK